MTLPYNRNKCSLTLTVLILSSHMLVRLLSHTADLRSESVYGHANNSSYRNPKQLYLNTIQRLLNVSRMSYATYR
jgi:hypothetical protein